jgi:phenylpropionate dioxygenase-like ring-hydroxylating dioxygenase large terminal subunit
MHPNIAVPGFHKTDTDAILIDFSINIVQYRNVVESRPRWFSALRQKNGDDNTMAQFRSEDELHVTWTTLPAWTYNNAEFLALEKEAIFMRTWQIVGHVSELKRPGDYLRFDLLGESAIVLRDHDGKLRAFHNVCRHRAFRLLGNPAGRCDGLIRCRYHGFAYDLKGRLIAVPSEQEFDGIDKSELGLVPIEMDVFLGFVFIRFADDGGPRVAEQLAPFRDALALYRTEEMEPFGATSTTEIRADWKVAVDNNVEAYHVPIGHPGLQRLYGTTYTLEVQPLGVSRGGGPLRDQVSTNWSERHYQKLLPDVTHLPVERKRAWLYYSVFPNLAFDIYPDMIDYFQYLPISPGRSMSRSRSFVIPDSRREMHAARYLNMRINRQVTFEDVELVEGVQLGLGSRSYHIGPLSRKEARVRQFQELIIKRIPVAACIDPPEAGTVATRNLQLAATPAEPSHAFVAV